MAIYRHAGIDPVVIVLAAMTVGRSIDNARSDDGQCMPICRTRCIDFEGLSGESLLVCNR